jgi:hypothetical protein
MRHPSNMALPGIQVLDLKKGLRPNNHSLLGHTTIITPVVFCTTTQTPGPPPDHPHSLRLELSNKQ